MKPYSPSGRCKQTSSHTQVISRCLTHTHVSCHGPLRHWSFCLVPLPICNLRGPGRHWARHVTVCQRLPCMKVADAGREGVEKHVDVDFDGQALAGTAPEHTRSWSILDRTSCSLITFALHGPSSHQHWCSPGLERLGIPRNVVVIFLEKQSPAPATSRTPSDQHQVTLHHVPDKLHRGQI